MRRNTFTPNELGRKHLPVRTESINMANPLFTQEQCEKDVIMTLPPIFGGTAPGTTQTDPPATTSGTPSSNGGDGSGGQPGNDTTKDGSAGGSPDDPANQYLNDPKAIQSLLQQLSKLQQDLGKATGERDTFLQKQQEQERAQMNKEQQQAQDIQNLQNQVEQYHRVVEQMAIQNALLSQSDYQWHSVRQALSEINPDEIQVDIDLQNSQANVTGMDIAAKRIAQNCPWLLKSKTETQQQGSGSSSGGQRRQGSGAPPAPPTGNEAKQAKRADLIKKFPVIAH